VLLQQGGPSNIFVPEQKPRQTRQRQNQMADISAQGDTYTLPASAPPNAKDTASTVTIDGADGNSAEINLADPQAINDYVDSGPTIRSLRAFHKLQAPHLDGAVIDKMGAGQLGRVINIAAMLAQKAQTTSAESVQLAQTAKTNATESDQLSGASELAQKSGKAVSASSVSASVTDIKQAEDDASVPEIKQAAGDLAAVKDNLLSLTASHMRFGFSGSSSVTDIIQAEDGASVPDIKQAADGLAAVKYNRSNLTASHMRFFFPKIHPLVFPASLVAFEEAGGGVLKTNAEEIILSLLGSMGVERVLDPVGNYIEAIKCVLSELLKDPRGLVNLETLELFEPMFRNYEDKGVTTDLELLSDHPISVHALMMVRAHDAQLACHLLSRTEKDSELGTELREASAAGSGTKPPSATKLICDAVKRRGEKIDSPASSEAMCTTLTTIRVIFSNVARLNTAIMLLKSSYVRTKNRLEKFDLGMPMLIGSYIMRAITNGMEHYPHALYVAHNRSAMDAHLLFLRSISEDSKKLVALETAATAWDASFSAQCGHGTNTGLTHEIPSKLKPPPTHLLKPGPLANAAVAAAAFVGAPEGACSRCHQMGHVFKECTNDMICNHCLKPGHRAKDCTTSPSPRALAPHYKPPNGGRGGATR
jgi:hypothetical protein